MSPATVTAGTQPVYVQVDFLSQYAYVVNFNGGNAGSISQLAIDANGGLSPVGSPVPTGKGPTTLVLDGTGQFAYVTNSIDNTVSQYAVAADGTLTPLATATVSTGSQPVAIAVTVYASLAVIGVLVFTAIGIRRLITRRRSGPEPPRYANPPQAVSNRAGNSR